jgi:peptide/nickel transport system substrate-binding protein
MNTSPKAGSPRNWRRLAASVAIFGAMLLPVMALAQSPFIGTVEGPTTITDPAQFPTELHEAPELDALVAAGKLPPVEERVPVHDDLLVIQPVEMDGTYSDRPWRRAFTGPGDGANIRRVNRDTVLFFNPTMTEVGPNVAKSFTGSSDGKVWTLTLRKGMKWSDGEPFTADDFVFWYEHIVKNPDLGNSKVPIISVGGKLGTVEKVDDVTVRYTLPEPNFLFPEALAGYTVISSHGSFGQAAGGGGFAPAHYLEQFHPDFVDKDKLAALVKDSGFDNWALLFNARNNATLNPDLPVVTPWKVVTGANTDLWVIERNPYYFAVDTAGNQLPYINEVVTKLIGDIEAINFAALAGDLDYQARHLDVRKLPLFIENQEKAGYKLYLDPAESGANAMIAFNMTYDKDPVIGDLFAKPDFRRALALGIDRDQINETFFLGIGVPGSIVPAESNVYNPGAEYRTRWATLDVDKANAMLDSVGLSQKDADGYRLRPDGQRLRLVLGAVTGSFLDSTGIAEMVREQWAKIGIDATVEQMDRTLYSTRNAANENQMVIWDNGNTERLFSSPYNLIPAGADSFMGPLWGAWYASNGSAGVAPSPEMQEVMADYTKGPALPDAERIATGKRMWEIMADQVWNIGLVGIAPAVMGVRIAKTDLGNIPSRQLNNTDAMTPGISRPETFFWKD